MTHLDTFRNELLREREEHANSRKKIEELEDEILNIKEQIQSEEDPKKKVIPLKVINEKVKLDDIEVYTQSKVEAE